MGDLQDLELRGAVLAAGGPLVRLAPIVDVALATPAQIQQAVELRLQLVAASVGLAIARAWDTGRLGKPDPARPAHAEEVAGLLQLAAGHAVDDLAAAEARLVATQRFVAQLDARREGRLTPLDLLARDFELSPLATTLLFAIAAPQLRGELCRLYGILANDPQRPVVFEHLLVQLLDGDRARIAEELDGDRPLRRFGLIHVAEGDRPFVALTVDPLVVRAIANLPPEGEPDRLLSMRRADRTLEELQLPAPLVERALRFLSAPPAGDVRLVVCGATGSGRHCLLAALAALAGRALGVVDLTTTIKSGARLAGILQTELRRAQHRGLVPCVDGLELLGADEIDMRMQVARVLAEHPGPLALRLPIASRIPLEPGYLLLEIPPRTERERIEAWSRSLARHRLPLTDGTTLAARYRIGPGIVERVCVEISQRGDRATDAAGCQRELDAAIRQHLENRLGQTATRVTRLASWSDIVLPDDIRDVLVEMTSRVRHRRHVYEQWGFDRSITTARGITALFQGSPGTGKTMVAGVIARELGLELYRVDVSRITSKWIGETEKNLGALFDAAEEGQVLLLFDEADSLFAKRTEVKTSVDRYANMEVNYLLQRIDSFEGIAILTTNYGSAIDAAFKRRLTYRVTFPFPDEEMREQIWRTLIPSQMPVDGELDLGALARRYRLSGGYIRNTVLRAAFLAAEEGVPLSQALLERAVRIEFREMGKLAESGTLE